jgi:hypothetical protein
MLKGKKVKKGLIRPQNSFNIQGDPNNGFGIQRLRIASVEEEVAVRNDKVMV